MKKKKSFTLLETIVTITIYAVMLLMITNIVLINARLSQQLKMRSRVRSELSEIVTLIKRDVRNAASISSTCTGTSCTMTIENNIITWSYSSQQQKISKTVILPNQTTSQLEYYTGQYVKIESINFFIVQDTETQRSTVLLTLRAKGAKDVWNINNQIIQEIISTRVYDLTL